ncbi:hypothetical protein K438DRAFT_1828893 [Mycena galopus ATCC 62051]|nr:hypothetical protein K438DRAFT_1828893 [Mycena galopus ATCC 62051]
MPSPIVPLGLVLRACVRARNPPTTQTGQDRDGRKPINELCSLPFFISLLVITVLPRALRIGRLGLWGRDPYPVRVLISHCSRVHIRTLHNRHWRRR